MNTPIRVILDSNIYGLLINDGLGEAAIEKINIYKYDLAIYGMREIRKELRDSPKHTKDRYDLQSALLRLYDSLIRYHFLEAKPLAEQLAVLYYEEYVKNKGSLSWKEMKTDMIIVAQATMSRLDIVASHDNRSMLSEAAKSAYYTVNKEHNFITPNFIGYEEFKRKLF